jgi:hypothetical protein
MATELVVDVAVDFVVVVVVAPVPAWVVVPVLVALAAPPPHAAPTLTNAITPSTAARETLMTHLPRVTLAEAGPDL